MIKDQALNAITRGDTIKCTLIAGRWQGLTHKVPVVGDGSLRIIPQLDDIIDELGNKVTEEFMHEYPQGDFYYIDYPPIHSLDDIKIGNWYDCGDDATVKILDKLSDAFIVLSYSDNHKSFCLTTYEYSYVDLSSWSRVDPETYGFCVFDQDKKDYISIDPSQLKSYQV